MQKEIQQSNQDLIRNHIYQGHSLAILKQLPSESIDMCITSPPYYRMRSYHTDLQWWDEFEDCPHIAQAKKITKLHSGRGDAQKSGKYSEQEPVPDTEISYSTCLDCGGWYGELGQEPTVCLYLDHLMQIFDEIRRVLKKSGSFWVNMGDKMIDGDLQQIPAALGFRMKASGWKLKREIIWKKPNSMPQSDKRGFTRDWEYILWFVKDDDYYFETQYEPYSSITLEEIKKAYKGQATKDYKSANAQNPSDAKRNIIKSILANTGANSKEPHRQNNPHRMRIDGTYAKKMPKFGGNKAALYGNPTYSGKPWAPVLFGRIKRCVWDITTQSFHMEHTAVFPEALCVTPILATCPIKICTICNKPWIRNMEEKRVNTRPGKNTGTMKSGTDDDPNKGLHNSDLSKFRQTIIRKVGEYYPDCDCENANTKPGIVLDPFFGAGTAGLVASKLGRDFVGIELNKDYIQIAKNRLAPFLSKRRDTA